MKTRLLMIVIGYGIVATFFSFFEWPSEGIHFLLNLPGNLLAESVYTNSIELIGQPTSSQAHYSIPWILRIPQVIVPVSMFFWIGAGVIVQLFYNRFTYRNKQENSTVYHSSND